MRELSEQEIVRREKLNNIKNPYPERYETNYEICEASKLEDGISGVRVAGRIILMRKMGKMSFLTIGDIKGKVQVSVKIDMIGEDKYQDFKANYDLGDFIGVEGEVFTTHTGEKTIRANDITFLGKALKPLPEKFHGVEDIETIYRERYLDLITNDESKQKFLFRSKFTHHNALDIDLYLRIAPETYLKRAIVGGFTKVFEIARCFRNEGIDATHLQDFTMIEGYCAYYNYKDNMKFLREMLQTSIMNLFGTLKITIEYKEIYLSGEWEVVSFRELLLKYSDIDLNIYNTKEKLLTKIREDRLEIDSDVPLEDLGYGNLVDQLYKKVARVNVINPIFLTEHPINLSPLARANDNNPEITDRFQLVINGAEIINAYSELVDPQEQERRLTEQAKLKANGDEEAMPMDNDYISAMECGMPPISGWGMGIDRVVQLLTNSSNIKDVILFPLMRPIIDDNKDQW